MSKRYFNEHLIDADPFWFPAFRSADVQPIEVAGNHAIEITTSARFGNWTTVH